MKQNGVAYILYNKNGRIEVAVIEEENGGPIAFCGLVNWYSAKTV